MIPLREFEFHAPATMDETLSSLDALRGGVKVLAGGTDLVVAMKHGLNRPAHVVWPGKVDALRGITSNPDGSLSIGSMVTLADLSADPAVAARFPALAGAALRVASPQIRNRATIGGNLCINTRCFYYDHSEFWRGALCGCLKLGVDGGGVPAVCHAGPGLGVCAAVFFSDLAPVLIALGATVEIRARAGRRASPVSGLYGADGSAHLTLRPDELITAVTIPPPQANVRVAALKLSGRGAVDFPLASVAVSAGFDASGGCVSAAVVIGAVETRPVVFTEGTKMLVGRKPDAATISAVAGEAAAAVTPFPNAYESVGYRKKMVEVLVRRSLREVAG